MVLDARVVTRPHLIVTSRWAPYRREISPHNTRRHGTLCPWHAASHLFHTCLDMVNKSTTINIFTMKLRTTLKVVTLLWQQWLVECRTVAVIGMERMVVRYVFVSDQAVKKTIEWRRQCIHFASTSINPLACRRIMRVVGSNFERCHLLVIH